MSAPVEAEPVTAGTIAVLADCHIHPDGGPQFSKALLDALNGVDLIVTLGDMGEAAGLDQLAAIAPVLGVRGQDDADDPRTSPTVRTLRLGTAVAGCVFDAKTAGLASSAEPFTPVPDWTTAAEKLFGAQANLLLHAATHRAEVARVDGRLVVNPGSAVLPARAGAAPSPCSPSATGWWTRKSFPSAERLRAVCGAGRKPAKTPAVTAAAISRLTLTDFRSYERAELALDGRPVFLVGPNGAGKTNLLEAVSLLTPGRGLRGASLAEMGRRLPGEAQGRAWAVAAVVASGDDETKLGTGVEQAGAARRTVRLEGETVPPGRLADHLRQVWLTPAQDRLFLEGAGDRRRFFDRLVFAAEPLHAAHVGVYERAQRERTRLLTDGPADAAWLDALEARLAEAGALMADARARTLGALQAEIERRGDRPFPQARLSLAGPWEQMAAEGADIAAIEEKLAAALAAARDRDAAAGRALTGPHRGDLAVIHVEKDRPAGECSTGEQKALILNLVLAQAARLSRAESAPNPILLLDEVAAHLDRRRRAALFDEITALGLQAFLTGTDEQLFEDLKGRAQGVRVDASGLSPLDEA